MTRKTKNPRPSAGIPIENNGEDDEYLNQLSGVSDEQLGNFWDAIKALMETQKRDDGLTQAQRDAHDAKELENDPGFSVHFKAPRK